VTGNTTTSTATLDTGRPGNTYDDMVRRWRDLAGAGAPLPTFSSGTRAGLQGRFSAMRLQDILITNFDAASAFHTEGARQPGEDVIRLWLVHRGEWTLGNSRTDDELSLTAGQFVVRHVGRLTHFTTPPHTMAQVFVLPRAALEREVRDRAVSGPVGTAELRLLTAHARMVQRTLPGLSPAGVEAARNTLLELTRAVAKQQFDDQEPTLAVPLAQAAKDLAVRRLADPDLTPRRLALELGVSVRTLQRAFAAQGESVTGHLRERRLEAARAMLEAMPHGWNIADVAAHGQFADASHFSREFKARYGCTPSEYTRTHHAGGRLTGGDAHRPLVRPSMTDSSADSPSSSDR
jgi:AraC family transcriptional activator of tynA and feaB